MPLDTLAEFATRLDADPLDSFAWLQTARALANCAPEQAPSALRAAVKGLGDRGELLAAIAAVKALEKLDRVTAENAANQLARRFAHGAEPPVKRAPPPRAVASQPGSPSRAAATLDAEEALDLALAACQRAAKQTTEPISPPPYNVLFSDLDPLGFGAVVSLLSVRDCTQGQQIIGQGDPGSAFYVVVRGELKVERDGTELAYLRGGALFGEMSLLTRSPRLASVTCTRPSLLLEFDSDAVEALAQSNPNVGSVLADYMRNRLLRNLMATSPLFAPLAPQRREQLVQAFSSRLCQADEVVIAEGQDSGGLHVVLSGQVVVTREEDDGPLKVAELGPGQFFGEISLLRHSSATATVTASRRTALLVLQREAFNTMIAEYPEALAAIYKVAEDRSAANRQLERSGVVPVEQALLL